ncbi:MAG TPA: hypothetical protein VHB45_14280 [Alloacidobacterium sp.]|nr:hypothetical protein [Alloacidobacterium sp.]
MIDSLSHLPMATQAPIREKLAETRQLFEELARKLRAGEPYKEIEKRWWESRREVSRMLGAQL